MNVIPGNALSIGLWGMLVTTAGSPETDPTPSGEYALPLYYLRETLAASATFQTLVGEADAAATRRHIRYFGLDKPTLRAASTAYGLGEFVRSAAGSAFVFECTVAGTSGTAAPTWPTVAGGTVVDGTVTWTARAIYDKAEPLMGVVRAARPFGIVGLGEEYEQALVGRGMSNALSGSGSLILWLEADVPSDHTDTIGNAGMWWANQVGGILTEMKALAGTAGYLNITGFEQLEFYRAREEERQAEGDYVRVIFSVEWSD